MSKSTIEIISARERRRRWGVGEKLRIVAESHEPGATVGAVAARHDLYPSLLRTWRRQVREGRFSAAPSARFVPVRVTNTPPVLAPPAIDRSTAEIIEVVLPDGSRLRVGNDVNLAALRRVMTALRE